MKTVCSFSCGAASAVAAKLTLNEDPTAEVVNVWIKEEHKDNDRFRQDCEKWFGKKITVLKNEKYNGSVDEVIIKKRFLKGPRQTPCSFELKRNVLNSYIDCGQVIVLGYTCEEEDRANRLIDANNEKKFYFPLIETQLTKADCLALLKRAGIELPMMYRLGYNNNNCIGCVKGGMGYWNRIRRDFPERFEQMARFEEIIGARLFHREGIRLRELDPNRGWFKEPEISCSYFCELEEKKWRDEDAT